MVAEVLSWQELYVHRLNTWHSEHHSGPPTPSQLPSPPSRTHWLTTATPPSCPPAGLPTEFNDTFFCNADGSCCYEYVGAAEIWPLARQRCRRAGGDLAVIKSFEEQVEVEGWVARAGGAIRKGSGSSSSSTGGGGM
jgi:hypothetical protein